jgi:hypothetical protein
LGRADNQLRRLCFGMSSQIHQCPNVVPRFSRVSLISCWPPHVPQGERAYRRFAFLSSQSNVVLAHIGMQGIIVKEYISVDPTKHSEELLAALPTMQHLR